MIEDMKKNLEQEKRIVEEMKLINIQLQNAVGEAEKRFYLSSLKSFKGQLKVLNKSIPSLLGESSPIKKLEHLDSNEVQKKKKDKVVRMSYVSPSSKEKRYITINKEDKKQYVKDLSLSEESLKKLRRTAMKKEKTLVKTPSQIAHYSNRIFGRFSEKLAMRFSSLRKDLRQANIHFPVSTYLSIAFFISFLSFALSFLVFGILAVIDFSLLIWIWVPFALGVSCFVGFYVYPTLEKSSVEKRLYSELPFATIYMAAIAGSNIEPTKIFKIIAKSPEYPNFGFEIKKIINQVELYGYDLVSVLKRASKTASNKDLAELFSGMATNIVSGGALKDYLEKKSENLLMDYKLKRQKYNALAGTFMDIYISVLITAPLVLMMMFIILKFTNFTSLSLPFISIVSIGGVTIVNVIFMIVLKLKQPDI